MSTYCGADCKTCQFQKDCKGCLSTCGSPFGGRCIAAETIRAAGMEAYRALRDRLTDEVNALLAAQGFPAAERLYELVGSYVNLEYPTPGGRSVKLLNDANVYLGAQIELPGSERCIGVVADEAFILICSYGASGSAPELLLYKKR